MQKALWFGRLLSAVVVAAFLGYVPVHIYGGTGLGKYMKLKGERDALLEKNIKLHQKNESLRAELDSLVDPERPSEIGRSAIERTARDELGLVRPGEIVFSFGDGR